MTKVVLNYCESKADGEIDPSKVSVQLGTWTEVSEEDCSILRYGVHELNKEEKFGMYVLLECPDKSNLMTIPQVLEYAKEKMLNNV